MKSIMNPRTSLITESAQKLRLQQVSKRGLQLNMLLIGENGIGKRSFINTLCRQSYFQSESVEEIEYNSIENKQFSLENHVVDIIEPESIPVKLKFTITKNFGYNIENCDNSDAILKFVEGNYLTVLEQEQKVNRNPRFEDNRIHVGIYFIKPTGKGLNELDIECMKLLSERINLIPILSKIDGLTEAEFNLNKELINEDLARNDINVYNFLEHLENNDTEEIEYLSYLQKKLPFGIINSNSINEENQFIRINKFGVIDIENESICDIKLLKTILFGSHLQEFKDITVNNKYECFRVQQLEKLTIS